MLLTSVVARREKAAALAKQRGISEEEAYNLLSPSPSASASSATVPPFPSSPPRPATAGAAASLASPRAGSPPQTARRFAGTATKGAEQKQQSRVSSPQPPQRRIDTPLMSPREMVGESDGEIWTILCFLMTCWCDCAFDNGLCGECLRC